MAAPGPAGLLRLQRTVGNAAVAGAVRAQRESEAAANRMARFRAARSDGDWAGVAATLLDSDERWMVERLHSLDGDQLRHLDDAVRRMGVRNSRLRIFIRAGLRQLGADDDGAAPGGAYGELEGRATAVHNGRVRPGHPNDQASYRFEVTFAPRAGAVDAEEIDFIQSARVVSTVQSSPDPVGQPDWATRGANGRDRELADHTRVDRLPGMAEGWIGMQDDGSAGRHLRPWKPGSRAPAWMTDTPSRTQPDVDFHFETAAVCRRGPDAGKVYATVEWGFTIDHAMQVVPREPHYFNAESPDFDLAVAFWNAEAVRSGGTQHELPASLR